MHKTVQRFLEIVVACGMVQASVLHGAVAPPKTVDWNAVNMAEVEPGELLVRFRRPLDPRRTTGVVALRQNVHAVQGATLKRRFERIPWDVVRVPAGVSLEEAAAAYADHPEVAFVEPNYRYYPTETIPFDELYSNLWGMVRIRAPEAWDSTTGSDGIVVGVIDTGINLEHEDLVDNLWHNPGESGLDSNGVDRATNGIDDDDNGFIDDVTGWDFYDNDNDPTDIGGHGTHVSGTIGAVGNNFVGVVGVNWTVRLMPLRGLGPFGGTTAQLAAAVEYAASFSNVVKLTNNSWGGGGESFMMRDALALARQSGQLFIAAAGNSAVDNDEFPHFPSSYEDENVISVASINVEGERSNFSNWGLESVDLAAPGSDILSCWIGGPDQYNTINGTSMATPHVAGAAALLWSLDPSLSWRTIRDAILGGAAPNEALEGLVATGAELDLVGAMSGGIMQPSGRFISVGEPFSGGPYEPSNKTYTVTTLLSASETWQVAYDEPWLIVQPTNFTLPTATSTDVVFSVDAAVAATMDEGTYVQTVRFMNAATGEEDFTREAILRLGPNYDIQSTAYDWVDPISEGHAPVSLILGRTEALAVPFDVRFYEGTYDMMYLSQRGVLGFLDQQVPGENTPIPTMESPNGMVCPFWDGLQMLPQSPVFYGVSGTAPERRVVATWSGVKHPDAPAERISFQVIIPESASSNENDIIFQYNNVAQDDPVIGGGRSASIGVEDIDGLLSRNYLYVGGEMVANGQAVRFTMYPSPDTNAPTAHISPLEETSESVTFEIRFNEIVRGLTTNDLVVSGNGSIGTVLGDVVGSGERYTVAVGGISGHGVIELSVLADAVVDLAGNPNELIGPALYVIPLAEPVFFDNMEAGPELWSVSEGVAGVYTLDGWEWGAPSYVFGPPAAFSGSSCWGTVLDGTYTNRMRAWLESPPIRVGNRPVIEFNAWLDLEFDLDFAFVEVNDGTGWINVTPGGAYSGNIWGWYPYRIPLAHDRFGNREIRIRFRVETDASVYMAGFYVDDLRVTSRRAPGVWVYSTSPSALPLGATTDVQFVVYNTDTTTYHDVSGTVEVFNEGLSLPGNGTILYGDVAPGAIVTGAPDVALLLEDGGISSSLAELYHLATAPGEGSFESYVQLPVTGVPSPYGTNLLRATSAWGVMDWVGRYLPGDGTAGASIFQAVYAGPDGLVDPPTASGGTTGDDVLLLPAGSTVTFGRFGEGDATPADLGRFMKPFTHGLTPGAGVYLRAWNGPSFAGSVAYGESAVVALQGLEEETVDFGSWQTDRPIDFVRDLNGDSIPDGWSVLNGLEAVAPLGPLAASWTAESLAGEEGEDLGQMIYPQSVAASEDFVFVADTRNSRVQVWTPDLSTLVDTVGSQGSGSNELHWPGGVAVDAAGTRLVVGDTKNNRVVLYDVDPGSGALTWADSFGGPGWWSGAFDKPHGVAVDPAGQIYVADTGNSRVQVFDAAGVYQWSVGNGLFQPLGVRAGADGRFYVADTDNHRVVVYDSNAVQVASFGTNGVGVGEFFRPADVAVDAFGRVYVVDNGNHRVQVFDAAYQFVAAYKPPTGEIGSLPGQLRFPQGLCLSADELRLYVADTWNHRVQQFSLIMDADGDGMDDVWEDMNGLDSTDPSDGLIDSDRDGLFNIGEYRIGTDPLKADSNGNGISDGRELALGNNPLAVFDGLRITGAAGLPDVVTWNAESGALYRIQFAADLYSADWSDTGMVNAANASVLSWTNPAAPTNRIYFYRAIEEQ